MLNIIKMDLSVMKRYLYFIAFYAVFFPLCFQNNGYIGAITVLCVYIFVIGSLSVEERDKIHILHRSLPVTPGQIVGAKYVESLLVWIYAVVINFVVYYVMNRFIPGFQLKTNNIDTTITSLIMLLVFVAVSMPLVYKFGYMKSRIFIVLLWVAGSMMYPMLAIFGQNGGVSAAFLNPPVFVVLAGAAVLYVASWLVCIRVYKHKSF